MLYELSRAVLNFHVIANQRQALTSLAAVLIDHDDATHRHATCEAHHPAPEEIRQFGAVLLPDIEPITEHIRLLLV